MMTDNALADLGTLWVLGSGDTGRGGAEHRGFLQLWFTHQSLLEIGQLNLAPLIQRAIRVHRGDGS